MPLRILHINTHDKSGGAGRAVSRLHIHLAQLGIESRMLVGVVSESDSFVSRLRSPKQNFWDCLLSLTSAQYLFYWSSYRLPHHRWVEQSNIINLHNTHGGYFAHTVLPKLSRYRPIVWTLHDMWALTGHCSYSFECEKWRTGCGVCPYLNEYPRLLFDTTAMLWKIKESVYADSNLTLVSPSRWLANIAHTSPLLARFPIYVIPNGVDTQIFEPVAKSDARASLALPNDQPIILWAGDEGQEFRKGRTFRDQVIDHFKMENLPMTNVIMGDGHLEEQLPGSVRIIKRPRVTSELEMAIYYNAADLFILPTRADNLPNTAIESLACGTPVVSFAVGGVPEIVTHGQNGYLARPLDFGDLIEGIRILLDNSSLRRMFADDARASAVAKFDVTLQARRYLELYENVLSQNAKLSTAP